MKGFLIAVFVILAMFLLTVDYLKYGDDIRNNAWTVTDK